MTTHVVGWRGSVGRVVDYALELSLDAESEAAVVAQWEALRAAGLPSQADHKQMTNAPHLTLVAAQDLDPEVRARAAASVRPLLPTTITVRGLLLLGETSRMTVAHLVEPSPELARATEELRRGIPALRHPVWTPHLTLARRVPRSRLPELLAVLHATQQPRHLVATRLRWWDPVSGTIEQL